LADVDLSDVARAAADEVRATAATRGVAVAVDASASAVVAGDESMLVRAVANLLENAVRVAPAGSTVAVRIDGDGTHASLSVSDDGPGVAEQHRAQIFEPFWRGDRAGSSGLGLSIARRIAEAHGGALTLEPTETGARFELRLPTAALDRPEGART
jgi:two-component system OmpR family sensor kinase